MKIYCFHTILRKVLFPGFLLVLMHFQSLAQDNNTSAKDTFDINKASFRLPLPKPGRKYTHAISFIHLVIPKDWTLDFINAPMFSYEGKYALPKGFTLEGSVATLFI